MLRALLVAFAGQLAVAAVLFIIILWRERVKRREILDRDGVSNHTHDRQWLARIPSR